MYSVNGTTDTSAWKYTPHKGRKVEGEIVQDMYANGFRLPTEWEWEYAALGGQNYNYAGSDNLDEVGWYAGNSDYVLQPVATKKPNGYSLSDMSGNVWEWVWDSYPDNPACRCLRGGSFGISAGHCEVSYRGGDRANFQCNGFGFRLLRQTD